MTNIVLLSITGLICCVLSIVLAFKKLSKRYAYIALVCSISLYGMALCGLFFISTAILFLSLLDKSEINSSIHMSLQIGWNLASAYMHYRLIAIVISNGFKNLIFGCILTNHSLAAVYSLLIAVFCQKKLPVKEDHYPKKEAA